MSERFSKKEFIKATRITFPSRRQILIFSGFILGLAVLFFIFPPERYPQTSNKWYIFMLSIYCIFLIRCLFRKTNEDSPFHRCPNCGHSIIISIADTEPLTNGIVPTFSCSFGEPPVNQVKYNNGISPFCKKTIWLDEPENEFQGKKISLCFLKEKQNSLEWRYPLLFLSVLGPWFGLIFLICHFLNFAGAFIPLATLPLMMRWGETFARRHSGFPQCPACGIKWPNIRFELKTGRCHCCGELVVDLPETKPATSPTRGAEAGK